MLSFTTMPTHFLVSPNSFTGLTTQAFPFSFLEPKSSRRGQLIKQQRFVPLIFVAMKETGSLLGFVDLKKRNYRDWCWGCGGFVRGCKKDCESEGDLALETEILEFMKNSETPEVFPSQKQLIDAGRMDLVEGILKQGGWLALGWDLDETENEEDGVLDNEDIDWYSTKDEECNDAVIQDRVLDCNEERSHEVSGYHFNLYSSTSSSGRSLDAAAEDDSGIEGILSRLEKETNMNFRFSLREKWNDTHVKGNYLSYEWLARASKNVTVAGLKRNNLPALLNANNVVISDLGDKLGHGKSVSDIDGSKNSLKPEMWRTWSNQGEGSSEFEAAEICSSGTRTEYKMDDLANKLYETSEDANESLNSSQKGICHNQIQSRVRHLEFELSSALNALKSNSGASVPKKDRESSSDDLMKLSDAWEFQENEIMNAQDKLRSMRAKLAVLEGKMALAIIDAQKIVEEKQKRIDDVCRALQLLRTTCIVWPNLASEVLLAGSFDGWATQRKMKRSRTGVFSLYLKLYPGRHEIKFIVDGEWRIDPLRPIVHNSGYENNLLIIT